MKKEGRRSQSPRNRSPSPVEQREQSSRVGILCCTREYSPEGQSHFSTDEEGTLQLIFLDLVCCVRSITSASSPPVAKKSTFCSAFDFRNSKILINPHIGFKVLGELVHPHQRISWGSYCEESIVNGNGHDLKLIVVTLLINYNG